MSGFSFWVLPAFRLGNPTTQAIAIICMVAYPFLIGFAFKNWFLLDKEKPQPSIKDRFMCFVLVALVPLVIAGSLYGFFRSA